MLFLALAGTTSVLAEPLDPDADYAPWLQRIADALDEQGIDILPSLNHRELARGRPERPRLGGFSDIPVGRLPSTGQLSAWEGAYSEDTIGGIALIAQDAESTVAATNYEAFLQRWFVTPDPQRVFISYAATDKGIADQVQRNLYEAGFAALGFLDAVSIDRAGRLYATAGVRMAIDSREARRIGGEVEEFDFLGQRIRRNSDSIFRADERVARNEPAVFRKHTLGDENEASTIEEIVVPGGIALGEEAELPDDFDELVYTGGVLLAVDRAGTRWSLPETALATIRSLFDYVQRSEMLNSDAVVDIDAQGRVSISDALRDTDAGYRFVEIDTQPFNHVRNLPVTKSVIIDTGVTFEPDLSRHALDFSAVYEVRFLSADTMRIAQTRVALEYVYEHTGGARVHTYSWGRDVSRLDENLDYDGLGEKTAQLAEYAAWAALFRTVARQDIRFLDGRYEFLKIDTGGRNTPSRF